MCADGLGLLVAEQRRASLGPRYVATLCNVQLTPATMQDDTTAHSRHRSSNRVNNLAAIAQQQQALQQ